MSILTDELFKNLKQDLEGHLDAYQIENLGSGDIWPDATPAQAACWFLGASLFKKYNDSDRPGIEATEAALTKWLSINTANRDFEFREHLLIDSELINDVSDELYRFWYVGEGRTQPLVSSFNELYEHGKVGNGSNLGARGVDFYTKMYDSPLSYVGADLPFIWQRLSASNPVHLSAEMLRCSTYGFRSVSGSKLGFVNKNVNIARCIATEPTLNMWFQRGLGEILERRLKSRYAIDIKRGKTSAQHEINGAMARAGSISGRLATIDMESASDLFSLAMCRRVFPRDMYNWMVLLRSPTTLLPSGESVELHSMSTMGNGFTFPMMTMLFCAVITVVYKRLGIPVRNTGPAAERNFAVFGDDLIVDHRAVRLLYKLLGLLGFRVNFSKSYVEGPFRESCGQDFYSGQRVRGVYIKRLQTIQDHVVSINGLVRWSAVVGIPLPKLVGCLLRFARKKGPVLWGPPDEADDACIHVPIDLALGVKCVYPGTYSYVKWESKPIRLKICHKSERILNQPELAARTYNLDGLVATFLFGALRGGVLTVSDKKRRSAYTMKHRVTSSWSSLSRERRDLGFDWRHWSSAARDCF